MTQEQKDLLIKDLCYRLPYEVKAEYKNEKFVIEYVSPIYEDVKLDNYETWTVGVSDVRPYLFPLSSMNEEQWMDTPYANLNNFTFDSFKCGCSTLVFETYEVNLNYVVEFINWCYKNHFDCNGLIPLGLAIDATGKNIY